jgi:hypothetical protein
MTQRLDVVVAKTMGNGKTYWTRVGSAWMKDDGPGFTLIFDALPVPTKNTKTGEYEIRCVGMVPREQHAERDPSSDRRSKRQADAGGPSDDIPF